jgi:hypothetical protein
MHQAMSKGSVASFRRANRWWLRIVTATAIAGAGAMAQASVPTTWIKGQSLTAADLNQNFVSLDQRLGTLESAAQSLASQVSQLQEAVAPGAVVFFNLAACPAGWSALVTAQGRYVVGLAPGGTVAAAVGTALSDQENRATGQHSHTVSDPGHSHGIADPGHSHGPASGGAFLANFINNAPVNVPMGGGYGFAQAATTQGATTGVSVQSAMTGASINAAGSVAGTNAPYIQLLACQKN